MKIWALTLCQEDVKAYKDYLRTRLGHDLGEEYPNLMSFLDGHDDDQVLSICVAQNILPDVYKGRPGIFNNTACSEIMFEYLFGTSQSFGRANHEKFRPPYLYNFAVVVFLIVRHRSVSRVLIVCC